MAKEKSIAITLATVFFLTVVLYHTQKITAQPSGRGNPTPTVSQQDTSGVVTFRGKPRSRRYAGDAPCYNASLNEKIVVKLNSQEAFNLRQPGETLGSTCTFSVDVKPQGEWIPTGGHQDTPPYAFGDDVFYTTEWGSSSLKGDFSFTCAEPNFTLDTSSLPSFVTLEKEESLPGGNSTQPNGKRYFFVIGENANLTSTFNLKFRWSADCQMKEKREARGPQAPSGYQIYALTPVRSDCPTLGGQVNINPRQASQTLPIFVNEICPVLDGEPLTLTPTPTSPIGSPPTSTPTLTDAESTPTPTSPIGSPPTSTPTSIPIPPPSSTPSPPPSPTPEPSCDCDGIKYTGEFKPGGNVTFTAYATVSDPAKNPAEVLSMVYNIEKERKGGEAVIEPVQVQVADPPVYDGEENVNRYKTSFTFNIPEQGQGETAYYLWVKINCGFKQAAGNTKQLAQCSNQPILVMAANKNNQSIWQRILSIFSQLFKTRQAEPQPTITPRPTITPNVTIYTPQDAKSLQLGTFEPTLQPKVETGCTFVKFWVRY